jgi:hypothetical protein
MSQTITVNVVNSVSTSPSAGYFVIPGNFTSLFYPGFPFLLFNGSEELSYVTASSSFSVGVTQVNVNTPVYGSVVAIGPFTPGTGPFVSGVYTPAPTTTNSVRGSGATLQVTVIGPGPIATLGTIVGGSGYNNFSYTAVPLTGGTGTGAQATVVVSGGFVAQVFVTNPGTGYTVGDVLSANNANLGGFGAGFSVPVASTNGTISDVELVNAGLGYSAGDILTFGGLGYGTGSTVQVVTASTSETGSITLNNTQPMFVVGQVVYCITAGNAACQTPWWSQLPTQLPIPAVQQGYVLEVDVKYTNGTPSPTITYQVRLGSAPGVQSLDQSVVFIDLPTAIAAYEAQLAG